MRSLHTFTKIFLCRNPVDMRKQQNGLTMIIQIELDKNVFDKSLFVFLNRKGSLIRMLYWDDTGFAVWSKTLEKDAYRWPHRWFENLHLTLTAEQLEFLLQGVDLVEMKTHKTIEYQRVF
jgi:transposase